ncbi:MAG: B12-binding domain-containing radical SAM protein [Candidatus Diapherotrites archaeon]|nr:B12-binding domain-containing radical SAM protein [Candidatus Diapherotrites archaeon]
MTKKCIVLFMPKPSEYGYYRGLPLALMEICKLIDKKKFDVKIVAAHPDFDYKKEAIDAVDENTLLFGVSAMTGYQIKNSIEIIKFVRKKNPNIPIVWGGYHASILPKQTLESAYADIVVIGQGQRTFAELAQALANGKPLDKIRGIGYKCNGKIKINAERELEDVNNFPDIDFSLVDVEKHVIINEDGKRYINLCTSFGCPHRCTFCVEPIIFKRRWLALKPERVLKTMKYLIEKHNIEFFGFNDSNFFVDKERVRKICTEIVKNKWKIQWGDANGRTREMLMYDEKLWKLMAESGCKSILIGAEAGSQEMLELVGKDATVEDTVNFARVTREHNIDVVYSLMVGLPKHPECLKKSEAEKIVMREIRDILEMMDKSLPEKKYHAILLFVYTPYPGNPLFEVSKKCGFKEPKSLEEWADFEIVSNNVPWLSKKAYSAAQQLMDFVFPYACDYYKKKHIRSLGPLHDFFHKTALWRWKHRAFGFQIELSALKAFRWARAKANAFKEKKRSKN